MLRGRLLTSHLTLPGVDCAPFDRFAAQAELGLPVVRSAVP
jgi:hypothetical protein